MKSKSKSRNGRLHGPQGTASRDVRFVHDRKLTGKIGETVDYLITVTDTGSPPVKLEKITDANCTNMSAPSKTELKASGEIGDLHVRTQAHGSRELEERSDRRRQPQTRNLQLEVEVQAKPKASRSARNSVSGRLALTRPRN